MVPYMQQRRSTYNTQQSRAYAVARSINLRLALFLAASELTFLTLLMLKH
jgi:hypothetical protein